MIITTEKETILGNGSKSKAFSIAANPKVFKILSSDLYTNKIRAVVRELITNMIDAMLSMEILKNLSFKFQDD
ncbi:TPA: hypothetical protein ACUQ49_003342 [Escherichia coli]